MPTPTNYISKCGKFIPVFKFGVTCVIPSMSCWKSPVFDGAVVSRPVTLLKKLHQTHVSLLSIVGYIFFNFFLVVHLRKKYYFGKEKQYSTQSSVFLEQFYRMSGSHDTLYSKCRSNEFDMVMPHFTFSCHWRSIFFFSNRKSYMWRQLSIELFVHFCLNIMKLKLKGYWFSSGKGASEMLRHG